LVHSPDQILNMGNCGSNPKTDEGPLDIPKPVTREVQLENKESEANVDTKTEETLTDAENKSLRTLLDEVSHFFFKFQSTFQFSLIKFLTIFLLVFRCF